MAGTRAASALLRAVSQVVERNLWCGRPRLQNWSRAAGLFGPGLMVGRPPGAGYRMEALEERRLLSVAATINAASPINEGSACSLTLSATLSGGDAMSGWTVDWGDGSSPSSAGASTHTFAYHTYADGPADFAIHSTAIATIGATTHTDVDSLVMHVNNLDPETTVTHDSSADEGGLFSVVFSTNYSDPGSDTLTRWTIDWGDGSSDSYEGNPLSNGGQTMYHVFADGPATFGVTSTVEDEDGVYTNGAWDVAVFNVNASFAISAPTTKEGESFTLDIGYSDPGEDFVTDFHIDWGDGSAVDTLPGDAWYAEHMYTDGPTNHTVTAIAYASDANHTVSSTVHVDDVAPQWDILPAPAHTPQNKSVTFHWSGYDDAGTDTRSAWTVDWGDGTTASLSASANDFDHLYAAAGAYTASLSAVDGDGTYAQSMAFNIDDSDARGANPNDTLSFGLQTGMLIANYDDDNGDHITDYEETDPVSSADGCVTLPAAQLLR